jgi:hypothetical protein
MREAAQKDASACDAGHKLNSYFTEQLRQGPAKSSQPQEEQYGSKTKGGHGRDLQQGELVT